MHYDGISLEGSSLVEEHLIREIGRRFKRTPARQRVAEVRAFMGKSNANRKLIKKAFPELYQEATSSAHQDFSAAALSEPNRRVELYAKPRQRRTPSDHPIQR